MTQQRDIDRLLDQWFSDGPTRAADRVIDVVADRIERQPQRPAWRFHLREIHVNTIIRAGAAMAAVVIVAAIGFNLLSGSSPGVGGPATSPSPSPSPSSTPAPSPTPAPSAMTLPSPPTALAAGSYAAYQDSNAPFTFTVPAGWTMLDDLALIRTDGPQGDVVMFWGSMRIASKDAACPETPEAGVGHTAAALIADLAANTGLAASAPQSISVGGLNGQMIDVRIAPDWTRPCPPPFTAGMPVVPLITDVDPASGPSWGVKDHGKVRVIALEVPGGENFVITIDSAGGSSFDSTVTAAMPIIESMAFGSRS